MSVTDDITRLHGWANECRILLYGLEDDLDWRSMSSYNLNQLGGLGWIVLKNRYVISELIEAVQWFVYGHSSSFNYVYWRQLHLGLIDEAGEITWQAICEAWVANDFEGRMPTIAIIDRMRQILWNEPYQVTWAARPENLEL